MCKRYSLTFFGKNEFSLRTKQQKQRKKQSDQTEPWYHPSLTKELFLPKVPEKLQNPVLKILLF